MDLEARLAEFSRARLDGRPVPQDLRTMLVAQWEGRTDFRDVLGVTFFEPDQVHPLLDISHLSEEERADPETRAITAGAAQMSTYARLVAEADRGWVGYWLHPEEPADRPPPLIELDTAFSFRGVPGRTLAEACAAGSARRDQPEERFAFVLLASQLADLGLPLSTDDYDALHHPVYAKDPNELVDELIDAELARRDLA